MSSEYQEFGFNDGDENIQSNKFDRFKAKAGETYRISFVWWDTVGDRPNIDAKSPRFIMAKRHYIQGVGYFLSKGPEYDKLAGGPPKSQIATVIVVWPTDRKGSLDKTRFQAGDVEVKPWIFGQDKYDQLKRRHEEFPFGSFDLSIVCTDTQYQKMDLSPCRDNFFRKCLENDKLKFIADDIIAKTNTIVGNNAQGVPEGLRGIIARDLSLDKIREKLGGAPTGASASLGGDSQIDAMLDDLIDS